MNMEPKELPHDIKERLLELFEDSPLNEEPLTPEQEELVDRMMGREPKAAPALFRAQRPK
jgi:hypothetical protein